MIIKLIKNTLQTSLKQRINGLLNYIKDPKEQRIEKLTSYIHQPHTSSPQNWESRSEKCVYANARNFLDDDPEQQKIEMLQTAKLNSRVEDPIVHLVYSFKKFEVPTIQQIEQQIDILTKHLNAEDLQIQYALHLDTDNTHCHVVINKVHPFLRNQHHQHKCIDLGGGWIINAMHRAIAEIEARQHFVPEPNPLFIYNPNTQQCEKNTNYVDHHEGEKLTSKIMDAEHKHFQKSDLRQNIQSDNLYLTYIEQQVRKILPQVDSWKKFHQELAKVGLSYSKKRNGAIFELNTHEGVKDFKASLFSNKTLTLAVLTKRFGDFETTIEKINVQLKDSIKQPISMQEKMTLHPYHLFRMEDYIVKPLHDIYQTFKFRKEQITSLSKHQILIHDFDQTRYKKHLDKCRQYFYEQYPSFDQKTVNVLLHLDGLAHQKKLKNDRTKQYHAEHKILSRDIGDRLSHVLPLTGLEATEKITSYALFLEQLEPTHEWVLQQKFLFDQHQSRNFIYCQNTKFESAQVIYDRHHPSEPIAIANQHGIQVFSNFSNDRIQQCVQLLQGEELRYYRDKRNFSETIRALELNAKQDKIDENPKRFLPNLSLLNDAEQEQCFQQLYDSFRNFETQSTALIKASLMLSICELYSEKVEKICGKFIRKNHKALDFSSDQDLLKDIEIINGRIRQLCTTHPNKLIKQYFNHIEIDRVWQLSFEVSARMRTDLSSTMSDNASMKTHDRTHSSNLELVPLVPETKSYRSQETQERDDFALRMWQFFVQVQQLKQKPLNQFQPEPQAKKKASDYDISKLSQRYTIIRRLGHTLYIDQKKTAFVVAPNMEKIHVLSREKRHILDSLLLAKQQYGTVYVEGDTTFKQDVTQLARAYNIDIIVEAEPNATQQQHSHVEPQKTARPRELQLEARDPNIPLAEDRSPNFQRNQVEMTSSKPRKESNQSYDNDMTFRP